MRRAGWIAGSLAIGLGAAGCGALPGGEEPRGDPVAGAGLVENAVEPGCGRCHALSAAGFEGAVAPDLDEVRPGYRRVLDALRDGPGLMPSYDGQLSGQELHDVAAYISDAAARGPDPRPGPGDDEDEDDGNGAQEEEG